MEFLELIENVRQDAASVDHLFGREGRAPRRGTKSPEYMRNLSEAAQFVADIMKGRRPSYLLKEAMTTSDFPLYFGDIIDRQLLARYREAPATYRSYLKLGTVSDFRQVRRITMDGGEAVLTVVPEQTEYPEAALTEGRFSFAVAKYGRQMPFSWETQVNDDLEALTNIPDRFGRAARRTEEKFATGLFVSSTGPNATYYAAGNKNQVITANGAASNNPTLSIQGLQDAFTVLSKLVDADGEPIFTDMVHLVVPPQLEVIANNILKATSLWLTTAAGGGATGQQLVVENWMQNRVQLHVNYYLPIVNTTNGGTAWYIFADPAQARPAAEVAFLRGHNEPEVFMKEPDSIRVGGGSVNPLDGDFDTDSLRYKVRHVLGGSLLDVKASVASNGTGV